MSTLVNPQFSNQTWPGILIIFPGNRRAYVRHHIFQTRCKSCVICYRRRVFDMDICHSLRCNQCINTHQRRWTSRYPNAVSDSMLSKIHILLKNNSYCTHPVFPFCSSGLIYAIRVLDWIWLLAGAYCRRVLLVLVHWSPLISSLRDTLFLPPR